MADGTELFEIIHTTRAMRRLKPDPVPDALINRILEAGQCAPNGANAQQWCFLVVKDRSIKQAVQVWYQRAFDEVMGPHYRSSAPPPGMDPERYRRQAAAVQYLTEHFHEAPVWIVPCLQQQPTNRWSGASIYPAVQNMLLAARALGLGATLTTRHLVYEKETEAALGLPPGVHSYAIIPIGYARCVSASSFFFSFELVTVQRSQCGTKHIAQAAKNLFSQCKNLAEILSFFWYSHCAETMQICWVCSRPLFGTHKDR